MTIRRFSVSVNICSISSSYPLLHTVEVFVCEFYMKICWGKYGGTLWIELWSQCLLYITPKYDFNADFRYQKIFFLTSKIRFSDIRKYFLVSKNRIFFYIWRQFLITENRFQISENTWIRDIKYHDHLLISENDFLISEMFFLYQELICDIRKSFSGIRNSRWFFWHQKIISDIR